MNGIQLLQKATCITQIMPGIKAATIDFEMKF